MISPETATLSCTINLGDPKAKITWFKDGKELPVLDRIEMNIEGDSLTFNVTSSKVKDSGEYKLVAENKLGKITSKCQVEVLSK